MKKQEEALRLPQLATPFKQPRKVEHTVSPEGVKLLLVWNNHSYSVYIPWQISYLIDKSIASLYFFTASGILCPTYTMRCNITLVAPEA